MTIVRRLFAAICSYTENLGAGTVGSVRSQNWTFGTSRSAGSSVLKYSRGLKLNIPAIDVRRERLDLGVVLQDAVVVELPRVGDAVLGRGQLLLQRQEVLVRLQVGVRLGRARTADFSAPVSTFSACACCCRALRAASPRCGPATTLLEGARLVGGVALHRLDEVRDEVVPALELHVDLRPRVVDPVPQPDEAVVLRRRRTGRAGRRSR